MHLRLQQCTIFLVKRFILLRERAFEIIRVVGIDGLEDPWLLEIEQRTLNLLLLAQLHVEGFSFGVYHQPRSLARLVVVSHTALERTVRRVLRRSN
jgi:hypothetical protein